MILSAEQEAIRAMARAFAQGELKPHAAAWEAAGYLPDSVVAVLSVNAQATALKARNGSFSASKRSGASSVERGEAESGAKCGMGFSFEHVLVGGARGHHGVDLFAGGDGGGGAQRDAAQSAARMNRD